MTQLPLSPEPERKVKRLTLKEQHALNTFVQAEYVKSTLTDVEFSEKAAAFLSLPGINARHVGSAREIFDIPSNRDLARLEKKSAVAVSADLGPIEKRLDTLEAQVRKLFSLTSREIALTKIPSDKQIEQMFDQEVEKRQGEPAGVVVIELVRRVLRGEF
jgi:adenylate kinase family enzyme